MSAVPVWAGVIVADLGTSTAWYATELGCVPDEVGDGWQALRFRDGSVIELYAGDRGRPSLIFPSYGAEREPPVMTGFAVEEPASVAADLRVARSLPGWIVVVAPDGLRVVLTDRDGDGASGLVGFRYTSPKPAPQRQFFDRLGVMADVAEGDRGAVPVVAGSRDARVFDPDGGAVDIAGRR